MSINLDLPEDSQKLADLPARLLALVHEQLLAQAMLMCDIAQQLCPVDTGSLENSIRVEEASTENPSLSCAVRVIAGGEVVNPKTGKVVDYAWIVEAKTPFMLPAWLMTRDRLTETITTQVPNALNEQK